jgi:flagellar motility protein MotE (MotC chaperone)
MSVRSAKAHMLAMVFGAGLLTASLIAESAAQQPKPKPPEAKGSAHTGEAALYCKNISDKAVEARLSWQTWQLVALETKLKERAAELDRKQAEIEAWVKRREKILEGVETQVVSIIARMRPEAAAAQLSTADEDTATGVLLKLKARIASDILDEMDPARAARLTQLMVGLSDPEGERSF